MSPIPPDSFLEVQRVVDNLASSFGHVLVWDPEPTVLVRQWSRGAECTLCFRCAYIYARDNGDEGVGMGAGSTDPLERTAYAGTAIEKPCKPIDI